MEHTLTFKVEKEINIDVEDFASGIEDYFEDVLGDYCGLDDDDIDAVEFDKLKLEVARHWIMEIPTSGLDLLNTLML